MAPSQPQEGDQSYPVPRVDAFRSCVPHHRTRITFAKRGATVLIYDYELVSKLYMEGGARFGGTGAVAAHYGVTKDNAKQLVHRARIRGLISSALETREAHSCPCCGATKSRWRKNPR